MSDFDVARVGLPVAIANPVSFHPTYIAVIMAVAGALWFVSAAIALLTAKERRNVRSVICRLALWIFLPAGLAIVATFIMPNTPTYLRGFPPPSPRSERGEPFAILVKEVRARDRVLIHANGWETTEVHVPPACPIQRGGKAANFSDIRPGFVVDGIWIAIGPREYSASKITDFAPFSIRNNREGGR